MAWRSLCGKYVTIIFLVCYYQTLFFFTWEPYLSRVTIEHTHSPVKGHVVILLTPPKPVRTINFVVHLGMHGCHSNNNLVVPSSPVCMEHLLRVLWRYHSFLSFLSQIQPHACSPYKQYIYQESLEREETLCWGPRRTLNESEDFCFPWATAEDLRIGDLEVRRLLKVLVSWNVNKSLAKFTANLLYRVARTLSVLLKAKIVNSSANSRWQAITGCGLLPTVFHSPRPSPPEPYSLQKYVSWRDSFNFLNSHLTVGW